MYHHLKGILVEKKINTLVLEVQGIGYLVSVTSYTLESLPPIGEEVSILVYPVFRENEISLCGFSTHEERGLFLSLIRVSGIGPSTALQILGQAPLQILVRAIVTSDLIFLKSIKGLGKKTAERIIVELRDQLKQSSSCSAASPRNFS
ncbi:MAG: Holliday junction branch migration protein RuvA, partial [Planctomycetes bacterium]|nr:Holliday junction branch migration protein RuvA [Planctomycetota bacterium]